MNNRPQFRDVVPPHRHVKHEKRGNICVEVGNKVIRKTFPLKQDEVRSCMQVTRKSVGCSGQGNRMEQTRNACRIFVRKPSGERLLVKQRSR
jgi:hypothetical protein